MSDLLYIIGDTETAGLDGPTEHSSGVAEVAFLEFTENLEVIRTWASLIDPQRPMSPGATEVNGITDEMVKGQPTLEQFMQENAPKQPSVFIAHNVAFDRKFLLPHMHNVHAEVCTLQLARRHIRNVRNYKLGTLADDLGLEKGAAHRAAGDVFTTFNLLKYIICTTGVEISTLTKRSRSAAALPYMPFGKHMGKPFAQIPEPYLRWMLDQDMPADVIFSAELALKGKL